MEKEKLQAGSVHHGNNIRHIRRNLGIGQSEMAEKAGISPQELSNYEASREIDNGMLERFAKALNIPVELIRDMEENRPAIIIENNRITNNDQAVCNMSQYDNGDKNFQPVDKIIELYERMLKEQNERYESLEKRMNELERKKE